MGIKKRMVAMLSMLALLGCGTAYAEAIPQIPKRGIVEGFYGTPWSAEDRLRMLDFMGKHELNAYIYAPKDDPYHRDKWREPYPAAKIADLRRIIREAEKNNVEFIFAISPGLDMNFSGVRASLDKHRLLAKLSDMYKLGVRRFAIFFDDIGHKDAKGQAELLNELNAFCKSNWPDAHPLITVPTEYFSEDMLTSQGTCKPYTEVFAKTLDRDICVLYTGPGVVCEGIDHQDIAEVSKIYGRQVGVWWNYPVTDYLPGRFALGPLVGLEPAASAEMSEIYFNPMEYAELSMLTLSTAADWSEAPANYEPEAAWQKALQEQYGELAPDMQCFASHFQRMENNWAHVGRQDAPELYQHIGDLQARLHSNQPAEAEIAILRQDFTRMRAAASNLAGRLDERKLSECAPQLVEFMVAGEAGEMTLQVLESRRQGKKSPSLERDLESWLEASTDFVPEWPGSSKLAGQLEKLIARQQGRDLILAPGVKKINSNFTGIKDFARQVLGKQ